MPSWVEECEAGTILRVWVVPGASRTSIDGTYGDALKIRVAAPPERGRANQAVVDHLEGLLGAKVTLDSGSGSRRKLLVVAGLAPEAVTERLSGRA